MVSLYQPLEIIAEVAIALLSLRLVLIESSSSRSEMIFYEAPNGLTTFVTRLRNLTVPFIFEFPMGLDGKCLEIDLALESTKDCSWQNSMSLPIAGSMGSGRMEADADGYKLRNPCHHDNFVR